MEESPAQTLFAHLLREASRFLFYPTRIRRSRSNLGTQQLIDKLLRQLIEWRKTFAPRGADPAIEKLSEPVFLDELYCRDLLREVPSIVQRTRALAHLTLAGVTGESFVYLREAANCYILGLHQAAVALARAAVEVPLRKAASGKFGSTAVAGLGLFELLKDFASRGRLLSQESVGRAHTIPIAADKVLHEQPAEASQTLEVIEAARLVVLELARRNDGKDR